MDSLMENYASSDEEDNQQQPESPAMGVTTNPASLFSSLPPPSRNLASLSPQISSASLKTLNEGVGGKDAKSKPSSFFSSLPPPKPNKAAKRLVEFKPPITYVEEEEEDDGPRRKKRASSDLVTSASASASAGGLSALLPPPKNTPLGAGAGENGHVGRRSILQIPSSDPQPNSVEPPQNDHEAYCNNSDNYSVDHGADPPYNTAPWSQSQSQSQSHGNWEVGVSATYDSTISYLQEEKNGQDEGLPQGIGGRGKKGRNQIPCDIIEVKQDELMSNRPREDQVKLTGIAFGPAYKPVSAAKGKPSKLHKRKHQIGSLYYDLKQKEMELAERRARGHLTKAETQAKYGW